MANHFFSINRGAGQSSGAAGSDVVTVGSSSTAGDDVELRVADAAALTKEDVVLLVDQLNRYIRDQSNFPPL